MRDKELEIALNDDNTISFSDYIKTRIAYETVCQEKDKEIEKLNKCIKDDKENANEIMAEQQQEIERLTKIEREHQRINGELREELQEFKEIQRIGREREYHSKFLKDFQKERGKNVFPDHDEIYKRYDDYKSRVEKAIKYIEDMQKHPSYCDTWSTTAPHDIICILKGSDKE